jgi:hypothetical protein
MLNSFQSRKHTAEPTSPFRIARTSINRGEKGMKKLEFCCGGCEETKSRAEAEETLVVRASGSVHQARSRSLLSAGPRSLPKKQRAPAQKGDASVPRSGIQTRPRTGTNPAGEPGRAAAGSGRGEAKGKEGVVLASGGGFLRPGARNRWKGSGRRAPLACPPASLFDSRAQNKADPAWNWATR